MEAFRDVLQRGARLLGDVLTFTRNAEVALGALEREKQRLDGQRCLLEEERNRASADAQRSAAALASHRKEIAALQSQIENARAERSAERKVFEVRLGDSQARNRFLEQELSTLRAKASDEAVRAPQLRELEHLGTRLEALEVELEHTRATLIAERARRDRAISLIKPASATAGHSTLTPVSP